MLFDGAAMGALASCGVITCFYRKVKRYWAMKEDNAR